MSKSEEVTPDGEQNIIKVLDHGYVRLIKWMGDDLDPVNAAKVSFDKESAEFGEKEARLLGFLAREEHTSVFRHSALTYEIYAPLFVARQWFKYAVASSHMEDQLGWNESSRRYVTEEPTFYVPAPNEWRTSPENKKQGSGEPMMSIADPVVFNSLSGSMGTRSWNGDYIATPKDYGNYWTAALEAYIAEGVLHYDQAMEANIAPEIARLFLPAYGMYVRWRWTASLGAVMHFLHQRLEHDAQVEIQDYAKATRDLTAGPFKECMRIIS